jgi:hypothetical protein
MGKVKRISIEWYQTWSRSVSYTHESTTPGPKTATDSSDDKSWPSIDQSSTSFGTILLKRSTPFFMWNLRVCFFFCKKIHFQQKVALFIGGSSIVFFQKATFKKIGIILAFWTGGYQRHIVLVWTKFKGQSRKVKKWDSFIRTLETVEWKSLLYKIFKVRSSQQQWNLGSFAQVWLLN